MALERTNSWGNQTELYIIRVHIYRAGEERLLRGLCINSGQSFKVLRIRAPSWIIKFSSQDPSLAEGGIKAVEL
jgi:hypothetical protein